MTDLDAAAHIRDLARRIGEVRAARVLAASRAVSQLESIVRPIGDERLLDLVFRLQKQLSERLPDKPEANA